MCVRCGVAVALVCRECVGKKSIDRVSVSVSGLRWGWGLNVNAHRKSDTLASWQLE